MKTTAELKRAARRLSNEMARSGVEHGPAMEEYQAVVAELLSREVWDW